MDWLHYWPIAFVVGEWTIRILLIPFAVRQHRPNVALAWLSFVFFAPYVGLFFYVLLARGSLARSRNRLHKRIVQEVESDPRMAFLREGAFPEELEEEPAASVSRLVQRLGRMPLVAGNQVELWGETEPSVGAMIEDIERAEKHVHMEFYIFRVDATGARVAEALVAAAKRGVKCRVLADAQASSHFLKFAAPQLRQAGVDVRAMLPVKLVRKKLHRLDLRNHRKLMVVDGKLAQTGSQNIADPDYGTKDLAWQDVWTRLRGPVVRQLQAVFCEDWAYETGSLPDDLGELFPDRDELWSGERGVPVQSVPSGPGYGNDSFRDVMVEIVHAARERVILTTPYFVPDEAFAAAIRITAMSGVVVDLVVPARSNSWMAQAAARGYYSELMDAGVNVWLHQRGLLHAKTVTVDDSLAVVGSGNFDRRSFSLNFELNIIGFGKRPAQTLRRQQEQYIEESQLLDAEEWKQRPAIRRMREDVAKLLAPLL